MEMKWKLEVETGNRNWKQKLETEKGTKDAPITGAIFHHSITRVFYLAIAIGLAL